MVLINIWGMGKSRFCPGKRYWRGGLTMPGESKAMKEIHDIRACNYEATKNMSRSELVLYMNTKAKQAAERLGIPHKRNV